MFKPLAGGLHFPSPCFPRQNSAGFPENWSRSVHGLLGLSCLYLWKLTDRRVLRDLWERKARPEENDGKRSGGGKIIETYWNTVFRRYSCLPGYLGLTPKVWQFHSNNYQKPEDLGVPIFRHFQTKPYVFIDFCHFYIGSCFAKLVHCLFFLNPTILIYCSLATINPCEGQTLSEENLRHLVPLFLSLVIWMWVKTNKAPRKVRRFNTPHKV